jgi:hypothetical protein
VSRSNNIQPDSHRREHDASRQIRNQHCFARRVASIAREHVAQPPCVPSALCGGLQRRRGEEGKPRIVDKYTN